MIPIITAMLPAIEISKNRAKWNPIILATAPRRILSPIIIFNLSVNRYAVIGGPIINATTSIEPTASNEDTAVIDTSDIRM